MKKLSRRQIILAPLAALVLGLVCWLLVEHGVGQRRVAKYKQELRAAGERLDLAELIPFPLAPEQNSAPLFRNLSHLLSTNEALLDRYALAPMRLIGPGRARVGWAEGHPGGFATNDWAGAEAAVDLDARFFQAAPQIMARPRFDFGLDYHHGPALPLPHVHPLRVSVNRLSMAVVSDLHRGDVSSAVTDLRTMLAIVRAWTGEPLMVAQYQRGHMVRLSMGATWELLQCTNVAESQLVELQRDWTELEFFRPAQKALEMERAMNEYTIERMRRSQAEFTKMTGIGRMGRSSGVPAAGQLLDAAASDTGARAQQTRWRWYLSYADELRLLKGTQAILETMRLAGSGQPLHAGMRQQDERLAAIGIRQLEEGDQNGSNDQYLRNMFSQSLLWLRQCPRLMALAESERQLATTAIALRRYYLREGKYPPGLQSLVPDLVTAVPLDPMDGRPVRYRLQPDGKFVLYCIGPDGIDNHGDGTSTEKTKRNAWQDGRDLVWPQPAEESR